MFWHFKHLVKTSRKKGKENNSINAICDALFIKNILWLNYTETCCCETRHSSFCKHSFLVCVFGHSNTLPTKMILKYCNFVCIHLSAFLLSTIMFFPLFARLFSFFWFDIVESPTRTRISRIYFLAINKRQCKYRHSIV